MSGTASPRRRRLAIVGGGSSGLITLKTALDALADWDVVCFERTDQVTGCWGNPYPGFVSTSTKYTTQFACYPEFDGEIEGDPTADKAEFFCDGQYGDYLNRFADHFDLRPHIRLNTSVTEIRRAQSGAGWELSIHRDAATGASNEHYDHVVVCTGLAAVASPINCDLPTLAAEDLNRPDGVGHIRDQTIVVVGGGETAVDYANRLSRADLGNQVFLSLQSGIRVSPRYHPIRGVPSDFLRTRLMLSIHHDIRNWLGQRFVEARIRFQRRFERWFPSGSVPTMELECESSQRQYETRKQWAYRLTKTAKDDLFNMFHNKSDDFLDAVAEGRLTIIGAPTDSSYRSFYQFQSSDQLAIQPDYVVPAIGYRSRLSDLFSPPVRLQDFFVGCCHVSYSDLFLVGFARPILGNIPSISEVQARYICGLIAGDFSRSQDLQQRHLREMERVKRSYPRLNTDAVYPVEMFPYCDRLAKMMGQQPTLRGLRSLRSWCRVQLTPATTLHYLYRDRSARKRFEATKIYLPTLLVLLLLALKPVDWVYRLWCWSVGKRG